ncbi:hypothetical protein Hanom_Chr12g01166161 [Helianthus anomalus]
MVIPRARSSGAASISSYFLATPPPVEARAMVRAAVKVVLPWSTWPMVPMLTWGFVRSNLPLAARTVRARRRWAAGAELEPGVWRKRFVEDLERKVEESSNLVEGFGRVKSEEEEEGDGEEEEKVAAAVAAAEMEAIGERIGFGGRWIE